MAVRKRFKPAEREAFKAGTEIEMLHGSRWVPAVIVDGVIIQEKSIYGDPGPYLVIKYTGPSTRTIMHGNIGHGTPGQIRLPVAKESR